VLNKSTFYGEPAQLCDAGGHQNQGLGATELATKLAGFSYSAIFWTTSYRALLQAGSQPVK
jgi:hypothetical protein